VADRSVTERRVLGAMYSKQLIDISREDFLKSHYWKFYSSNNGDFDENSTLIPQYHPDYDKNPVRLIYTHYTLKNGLIMNGFLYHSARKSVRTYHPSN
jgi:hypothetical protein